MSETQFFKCKQSVQIGTERIEAGTVFQAIETNYVLALLDNGLVCRLHVEGDHAIELSHNPNADSIQFGLLSTSDKMLELC